MVGEVFKLFTTIFERCVSWFNSLLSAVGGTDYVVAALLIVFVVALLIMPIRGGHFDVSSFVTDFGRSQIYNPKYSSGKWTIGNKGYKGKFVKGNTSARVVRNRKLRELRK